MARWYTVPLSVLVHAALLTALIAAPVLATNALPTPASVLVFVTVPPPPKVMMAPVASHVRVASTPLNARTSPVLLSAPEAPAFVPLVSGPATPLAFGSDVPVSRTFAPPPPDAPAFVPPAALPLRVGGVVKSPMKTFDVPPVYPAVARLARVEGTVILEATIDREGSVSDVHVLRSVPMLDAAALTAVRQWRYAPSRLNGDPVAVLMTVTVRFSLR